MIQPLRSAHRRVWYALALVLPAILVAGLLARPHGPRSPASMQALKLHETYFSAHAWTRLPIETRYFLDSRLPTPAIGFETKPDLNLADPLLYWSASLPDGDRLPPGALLMGEFHSGRLYPFPPVAAPGTHLILYSLAHRKVIDTATLERLQ
jgi:hypothetical protein